MKRTLRSLPPALFLFLLMGLQSVFGCPSAPATERSTAGIQVNLCHFFIDTDPADPCCDSAACHRAHLPLQNFGSPEYANQIKDLLPLILESRQQLPQSKAIKDFVPPSFSCKNTAQQPITSIAPRHALAFLRTTILLH
ncbi:hypothetical protein [Pelovirga terrestris]|uniref:Uncharacterized protein n=1 Tax=Pelovirga terrestris TaxID=2771352 RepID=A0A8J6QXG9_9BACT|nr:hypothetical protein [Pelovirga terrestris]MBD1400728.1 hypothetical protein [Pelovirga terrestris]